MRGKSKYFKTKSSIRGVFCMSFTFIQHLFQTLDVSSGVNRLYIFEVLFFFSIIPPFTTNSS